MKNTAPLRSRAASMRQILLQEAANIAAKNGFAAVTLQAVADASSLTKGGLLHHFPNKRALIDAVFAMLLEEMQTEIEVLSAPDHEPYGRFTRAYLEQALNAHKNGISKALWNSALADTHLNRTWQKWFYAQVEQGGDNERQIELEAVRFAVDGLWLGTLTNISPTRPDAIREFLRALTLPKET